MGLQGVREPQRDRVASVVGARNGCAVESELRCDERYEIWLAHTSALLGARARVVRREQLTVSLQSEPVYRRQT
jgi:hypothetical protein